MNIRAFHYDDEQKSLNVTIDAENVTDALGFLAKLGAGFDTPAPAVQPERKPRTTAKAKVGDVAEGHVSKPEPKEADPRQPSLPFEAPPAAAPETSVERFVTPALGASNPAPVDTTKRTPSKEEWAKSQAPAAPTSAGPAAPPDLVSAMSFKDVMVWMQRNGFATVEVIAAECAKYRGAVPVLGRISGPLEERIERALRVMTTAAN